MTDGKSSLDHLDGPGPSVESATTQFNRDWQSGLSPQIESVLAVHTDLDQTILLQSLLPAEIRQRQLLEEDVDAEEYAARFPEHQGLVDEVFGSEPALPELPPPPIRIAALPAIKESHGQFIRAGDKFASYVIEDVVGSGGMGVVYRAFHAELGRTVALKTIRLDGAQSRNAVRRFRVEAQAAAKLDHPGIVPVFDVGEQDGIPFYSMAFVDGESLTESVRKQPLSTRRAAEICLAVSHAVEHAHSHGIIHRDLKPHNILIGADGQPRVADFGLARSLMDDESNLTVDGQVLGTPAYTPPEQADGRGRESGPVADVYSIGAILYQTLVGRPPFYAPSPVETLRQVIDSEPVPLRQLNPRIDRDLETICLMCLEKKPARRYSSAAQLGDDLQAYLDHRPILARPIGWLRRIAKSCRRRPAAAALMGALLISVVVGTSIAIWLAAEANTRANEAVANLYVAQINRAYRELENGDVIAARDLLTSQLPEATGGVDHRGFEWHFLWNQCHESLQEFTVSNSAIGAFAISPDGTRIVAADSRSDELRVWDVATGKLQNGVPVGASDTVDLEFSPDGARLVTCGAGGEVNVWDWTSRKKLLTLTEPTAGVRCVTFSADGSLLAAGGGVTRKRGELFVWQMETGRLKRQLSGFTSRVEDVTFSPDGRLLVSAAGPTEANDSGGEVKILNVESGAVVRSLGSADIESCAFSPDGTRLAGASAHPAQRLILVWDVQTGAVLQRLTGHSKRITSVTYSPSGDRLASGSEDGMVIIRHSNSGRELMRIRSPEYHVQMPIRFTPDGRRIATHNPAKISLWNAWADAEPFEHPVSNAIVGGWNEYLQFKAHWTKIECVAFAPDGNQFATGEGLGHVKVWDLASRRLLHEFAAGNSNVMGLAFSPDGQSVATAIGNLNANSTPFGEAAIWDVASGRRRKLLSKHSVPATSVVYSPDGSRVASASNDRTWRVCDADSGECLHVATMPRWVTDIAYSSMRNRLAVSTGSGPVTADETPSGSLEIRDANSLSLLSSVELSAHIETIAFSPDSESIAAGAGPDVLIFEAKSGKQTANSADIRNKSTGWSSVRTGRGCFPGPPIAVFASGT